MNVIDLALAIEPAAGRELVLAEELREMGRFTEAGLRLGRAVEATLYGAAREVGIQLNGTVIKELESIREEVRNRMVHLLRKHTIEEVRRLSGISKSLAEAMANLANDKSRCAGTIGSSPRNNEQIFNDLLALTRDEGFKRRLALEKAVLHEIQTVRNRAAHASQDGDQQELTSDELSRLEEKARRFVRAVLDVKIGQQAKIIFGPPDAVAEPVGDGAPRGSLSTVI